jgi:hypothetical protein
MMSGNDPAGRPLSAHGGPDTATIAPVSVTPEAQPNVLQLRRYG